MHTGRSADNIRADMRARSLILAMGLCALFLSACGGEDSPPQFAASYDNAGGREWEQGYVHEGLAEGASEEQMACAVAFIKDHVRYAGEMSAGGFWMPPIAVMAQAGEECL